MITKEDQAVIDRIAAEEGVVALNLIVANTHLTNTKELATVVGQAFTLGMAAGIRAATIIATGKDPKDDNNKGDETK